VPDLCDFLHTVYVPSRLQLSPKTIKQLETTIRLLERWAGRHVVLGDLTEDLVRRFLLAYLADHSPGSTNLRRCDLLGLWNCAYDEGLLDRPPRARQVRKAKVPPRIPEAWTAAEVGRLLEAARWMRGRVAGMPMSHWFYSFLLTLYSTGERRGAVLAVEVADVCLEEAWILFRHTKTGAPRLCPLPENAVAAIRQIYDPARPLVWPWPKSQTQLERRFHNLCAKAGLHRAKGHCYHQLRCTAGTLVEQAGGRGDQFLGNSRAVFLAHYKDPRFFRDQLALLPRPTF
jgi:integrase